MDQNFEPDLIIFALVIFFDETEMPLSDNNDYVLVMARDNDNNVI